LLPFGGLNRHSVGNDNSPLGTRALIETLVGIAHMKLISNLGKPENAL
jgi:hypothetical protein